MRLLFFILILIVENSSYVHASEEDRSFINYCTEAEPQTLNPQKATDSNTFYVTRSIFNRLVEFKRGEVHLIPGLAQSWTISADQKNYRFKLRKNVEFQSNNFFTPTRIFNAEDVIFTFDRMLKKDHPYHNIGKGEYDYFNGMDIPDFLKEVKKIDETTVEFILHKPNAAFLSLLAMDFASILSQEYAEQMTKSKKPQFLDEYPIGTGPFYLETYTKDKRVVLAKFKKYWKKNIFLDSINFEIIKDSNIRNQKLLEGTCDMVGSLNYDDLEAFQRNKDFTVLSKPGLNTLYLALNVQKKPFNNIKVRQALSYVLNRKKYVEEVYKNQAMPAKNIIPPFVLGYNEQVRDYTYNPKLAENILKEEGVLSEPLELWVLPVPRVYLQEAQKLAQLIKEDFEKVGLKLTLITKEWSQYLEKTKKGEHTMALFGWMGDNGDPDNFFGILLSCHGVEVGSNRSRWCSKEFDDLIEEAKVSNSPKKRSDLYRRAQKVVREAIPHIPIAHAKIFRVYRNKIKNYKIDPLGGESFEDVKVKYK